MVAKMIETTIDGKVAARPVNVIQYFQQHSALHSQSPDDPPE
jgi:hypothetical protein